MVKIKLEPLVHAQPKLQPELSLWDETANENAIANFFKVKYEEDFEWLESTIQGVERGKKVSLLRDVDEVQNLVRSTVEESGGNKRMEKVLKMVWLAINQRVIRKINQLNEAHATARFNMDQDIRDKDREMHNKDQEIAEVESDKATLTIVAEEIQ